MPSHNAEILQTLFLKVETQVLFYKDFSKIKNEKKLKKRRNLRNAITSVLYLIASYYHFHYLN